LKKNGNVPQFGSFKYTAAKLFEKGVLISIEGTTSKQYLFLTIGSA
jgi:Ras GTPase-activating-like protein IQGAP2/3